MLFLRDTTNLPHGPGKPDNSHQYFSLSRLEGTTVGFSMTSKIYVSFIYLEEISFKGRYTFKLLVKEMFIVSPCPVAYWFPETCNITIIWKRKPSWSSETH